MEVQAARTGDRTDVAGGAAAEQQLTFELAGELFAMPILSVQEIRGWEKVSKTPQSPDSILGVMNLRGSVVPVLDLRRQLGIERCEITSTAVVIVVRVLNDEGTPVTVGCLVDAVSDVVNLAPDEMRAPPALCGNLDTHYLSGVGISGDRLVMMLDLTRLIRRMGAAPASSIAA